MSLSSEVRYAGFWRRFAAIYIDSTFVSLIALCARMLLGVSPFDISIMPQSPLRYVIARVIATYFVGPAIIVLWWVVSGGQSPGKWLMSIRIVKADGTRLGIGTGIVRYVGYTISGLFFSLGYLWMIGDSHKQTWHDKLAKTYVIVDDQRHPSFLSWLIGLVLPPLFLAGYFWMMAVSQGVVAVPSDLRARYEDFQTLRAIAELPTAVRAHVDLANTYLDQLNAIPGNDPQYAAKVRPIARQAVEELKLAQNLDPKDALIYTKLAGAYLWLDGDPAAEKAYDNAMTAYRLDPQERHILHTLGRALIGLKRYEESVTVLEKAIALDHTYAEVYQTLAYAYAQLGQNDKARSNYVSAIEFYTKTNTKGQYDRLIRGLQDARKALPK